MDTFEGAIKDYLLRIVEITGYVGQDIYFIDAPQELNTMYIRYRPVVPDNPFTAFGDITTSIPMIQFDIFGTDEADVLDCSYMVLNALHGFYGDFEHGFVISTSTASGPLVNKDSSVDGWYHGIVEWTPQYKR
jgi:hypothetical protein